MKTGNKNIEVLRRFGPWLIVVAIFCFLFWRIDVEAFWQSLKTANLILFFPLTAFFVLVWFLGESHNLAVLFSQFGHRIPYKKVVGARGVTYLLMVLNYNLGVGGIALYLKRLENISLSRSASILIFYMFSDIISLTGMSIIGSAFIYKTSVIAQNILYFSIIVFVTYCSGVFILRHLPDVSFFRKVRRFRILESFYEARPRAFFIIPIYRAMYFLTFIVFFYFALTAFNMHIPVLTLATVVPIIFFIGSLPITPFGLGTMQVAMVYFFKGFGEEPNILAFSIAFSGLILILRMFLGMLFMHKTGWPVMGDKEVDL